MLATQATMRGQCGLLRYDPGPVAAALDVDALAGPQRHVRRLDDRHQHSARRPDNHLLAPLRLVVLLLDFVAHYSATDGAQHHRDVSTRAPTDQAADA